MHYVSESDTGHMTLMHERLARFHEVQRERGMSAAALARLPKLPDAARRIELPPVVFATRKNARNPQQQARAKVTINERVRVRGKFAPRNLPPEVIARGSYYRGETDPQELARVKAIAGEVAKVCGIDDPQRMLFSKRIRRFGLGRKITTKLAHDLVRMSIHRIADVMGVETTSIRYYLRWLDENERYASIVYARSLEAVRARWPEYNAREAA